MRKAAQYLAIFFVITQVDRVANFIHLYQPADTPFYVLLSYGQSLGLAIGVYLSFFFVRQQKVKWASWAGIIVFGGADLFFNEFGLPNFEYKDEQARKITGHWDKFHYFRAGQEVEINEIKLPIRWNKPDSLEIEVSAFGKVDTIPYSLCKRNLKEILFKLL